MVSAESRKEWPHLPERNIFFVHEVTCLIRQFLQGCRLERSRECGMGGQVCDCRKGREEFYGLVSDCSIKPILSCFLQGCAGALHTLKVN